MKALFVTLCGCSRELEIDSIETHYILPIRNPNNMSPVALPVSLKDCQYLYREFKHCGTNYDGAELYRER